MRIWRQFCWHFQLMQFFGFQYANNRNLISQDIRFINEQGNYVDVNMNRCIIVCNTKKTLLMITTEEWNEHEWHHAYFKEHRKNLKTHYKSCGMIRWFCFINHVKIRQWSDKIISTLQQYTWKHLFIVIVIHLKTHFLSPIKWRAGFTWGSDNVIASGCW